MTKNTEGCKISIFVTTFDFLHNIHCVIIYVHLWLFQWKILFFAGGNEAVTLLLSFDKFIHKLQQYSREVFLKMFDMIESPC